MKCTLCAAGKSNNQFAKGAVVHTMYDVKRHECARGHIAHVTAQANLIKASLAKAQAAKDLSVRSVSGLLMLVCMTMVMSHTAASAFAPNLKMMRRAGVEVVAHTYNQHRYFFSALMCVSESLLQQQIRAVKESPYFSLLADTSSDVSGQDHMLIFVRYVCPVSFIAVTQYLCTMHMKAKTAEHIHLTLLAVLKSLGLDLGRLVGFCSDGDSTFCGHLNGVVVRLRRGVLSGVGVARESAVPWLLGVHCCAHKCALVVSDILHSKLLVDLVRDLASIDKLLALVHNLFAHSTKKIGQWARFAAQFHIKNVKFPMFNATRWFSRALCIKVLTDNWAVLVAYLSRYVAKAAGRPLDYWRKGEAVLKMLKDSRLMGILFVLRDLIGPLEFLSKMFQGTSSLMPHKISALVKDTISSLSKVSHKDALTGHHFKSWSQKIKVSQDSTHSLWEGSTGTVEMIGMYGVKDLTTLTDTFSDASIAGLNKRFPTELLHDFHIFDPSSYTALEKHDQLHDFGVTSLSSLLLAFCGEDGIRPVLQNEVVGIVTEEFFKLKEHMFSIRSSGLSMPLAWAQIYNEKRLLFPNLIFLAYIALCIPVETACVERGFSVHRVTKDKLKSVMKIVTVDALLRVKFLGDDEYDCDSAALALAQDEDRMVNKLFREVCDVAIPSFETGFEIGDEFVMPQEGEYDVEVAPDEPVDYNAEVVEEIIAEASAPTNALGIDLSKFGV